MQPSFKWSVINHYRKADEHATQFKTYIQDFYKELENSITTIDNIKDKVESIDQQQEELVNNKIDLDERDNLENDGNQDSHTVATWKFEINFR